MAVFILKCHVRSVVSNSMLSIYCTIDCMNRYKKGSDAGFLQTRQQRNLSVWAILRLGKLGAK